MDAGGGMIFMLVISSFWIVFLLIFCVSVMIVYRIWPLQNVRDIFSFFLDSHVERGMSIHDFSITQFIAKSNLR
ncbi:hypothetical protein BBBOND_0107270 [Babesia bigemina]|uniref:Uncharacterized protein n=1 Tax=Babesia bigemina TaxID=5866 RepID=A0A061D1A8_BABBI|nr:hypothetical protein BBBOND_0107270 [Babesia bigemina]CDR94418.1 hypothetical protein BBBOND_0107270 [Babesia bigemina]|eukprot:XP_012766604.1 hypothetical protein BBBOND_0107270 [Babesia bigemina]